MQIVNYIQLSRQQTIIDKRDIGDEKIVLQTLIDLLGGQYVALKRYTVVNTVYASIIHITFILIEGGTLRNLKEGVEFMVLIGLPDNLIMRLMNSVIDHLQAKGIKCLE